MFFALLNQVNKAAVYNKDWLTKKSNLHYTCGITPKRVTSGGARLRGLAPGQHRCEETLQRWRDVRDTADLIGLEIELRPPEPIAIFLTTISTGRSLTHNLSSPYFFRFGSFEIFKPEDNMTGRSGPSVGRSDILKQMLDYSISTFYPQIREHNPDAADEDVYLKFYEEVRSVCVMW